MTSSAPLLVPVLMIKNEAHTICETLTPLVQGGIQHFFIFDTGSDDETIEITQNFFAQHSQLTYKISQENFIDFASSRNRALQLAEEFYPDASFFIMPDAEWHLHGIPELLQFCREQQTLNAPLYNVKIIMNQSLAFYTARLFRRKAKIRFAGAVHEAPSTLCYDNAPSNCYFDYQSSSKSQEQTRRRWQRDLKLLLDAYQKNNQDPRGVFYLAQTYECLGDLKNAAVFYQKRAEINGWVEENFMTLYRLGGVIEQLSKIDKNYTWEMAQHYYLKAFNTRPQRIEPLVKIADYYWSIENIFTCYLFISYAYYAPYPIQDILFVEKNMYDYARYEIMSRCAWYMEQYELGEKATRIALSIHPELEHLQRNLSLYQGKLNEK